MELLSHRTLILRVNFTKSTLSPSQRILFLGTVLDSNESRIHARSCSGHAKTQGLLQEWHHSPHKSVSDDAGPNALPVLQLGLLRMQPLQRWLKPRVPPHAWRHRCLHIRVSHACVTALALWKNPRWMEKGVAIGMVCSRKVVTTDAFNTGWGALCKGKLAFGHWY